MADRALTPGERVEKNKIVMREMAPKSPEREKELEALALKAAANAPLAGRLV